MSNPGESTRPARNRAERRHPEHVDVKGAADYLGTTERHIRRLVYEKRLPYYKVGGKVRLSVDDLAGYLARCRVEAR